MRRFARGEVASVAHGGAPIHLAGLLAALLGLSACSSDPPAMTCSAIDLECTPAYEPTFDEVFTRTLKPSCAKSGPSCHGNAGRQRDLVFEDADTAYRLLVDHGLVRPGDAACSRVVVNVTSTDPFVRMPPAMALPADAQCAIARWIQDGAQR